MAVWIAGILVHAGAGNQGTIKGGSPGGSQLVTTSIQGTRHPRQIMEAWWPDPTDPLRDKGPAVLGEGGEEDKADVSSTGKKSSED